MKKVLGSLVLALFTLAGSAFADQLSFGGGTLTLTQAGTGCSGSPCVNFTFGGTSTINSSTQAGDTAVGTGFAIGGGPIDFTSIDSNGIGHFDNGSGTVTMGNSVSGIVSGGVSFVYITSDPYNPGSFTVSLDLSGLSFTAGSSSSSVLSQFARGGNGKVSFTFSDPNLPQNLSGLLNVAGTTTTSYSGTVAPVPEPGSFALLGTGLLAGGSWVRRNLLHRA